MNFRRGRVQEEPEINFIPLIDVLLVVVIFLLLTNSYNRFGELHVTLPTANTEASQIKPKELVVTISSSNQYALNGAKISFLDTQSLADQMKAKAGNDTNVPIVIHADAKTEHQSVMTLLHAAKLAGFASISYAVETKEK